MDHCIGDSIDKVSSTKDQKKAEKERKKAEKLEKLKAKQEKLAQVTVKKDSDEVCVLKLRLTYYTYVMMLDIS